jgi:hypothetical protein
MHVVLRAADLQQLASQLLTLLPNAVIKALSNAGVISGIRSHVAQT